MAAILTYHHIAEPGAAGAKANLCVSPRAFEAQLDYLRRTGREIVSLDRIGEALAGGAPLSPRAVALSFDDGYEDNYSAALPILKKFGATAAFFITTGWTGGLARDGTPCMNADQLRALAREGMTLGAHSVSHPRLAELPLAEAEREMGESKRALEATLGQPVRWLCYPSGSFSREVADAARRLGFAGACSVIRDNRCRARQIFWLPRVMVMPDTSPRRFAYYLSPLYGWAHALKNRKRWGGYL